VNVRKFSGSNTREALRQVRDALGADALILSNRRMEGGGVEIMAVADGEVQALTYDNHAHVNSSPSQKPAIAPETIAAILHRRQPGPGQSVRPPEFAAVRPPSPDTASRSAVTDTHAEPSPVYSRPTVSAMEPAASPSPVLPSLTTQIVTDPTVAELAQELKFMRNLLEGQLSGFAWGELARRDPLKAELMRTLLGGGFSPQLARRLIEALPEGLDYDQGIKWLKAALTHNLRAVEAGADLVERGGIVALVGPTGVGKTTTLAKLAARAVLKYGAERVALITTDSYRVGAHEQLNIYGRILNVPVHAVRDEAELELTLADLHRSHLVLIDTVGMSQRDRRIAEQIEFLCGQTGRIRRHLLLPATAQSVTLDDIVRAYRGAGMDGVILTKIDEAPTLAPAIDCLIRHGLDLHYVTNGQRVPEDLHLAHARYLVDRAFKPNNSSQAQSLKEEEWGVAIQWGNTSQMTMQGGHVG
jgi:flagellar biosynthesis protein FlhF